MEQELFSTQEAAKKLGIKPPAFRMKALRAGFEPAKVIQGKGKPQKFWTAKQIATIAGNARADVTETEGAAATVTPGTAEETDISTIAPAPVVDTETLIFEPLDNKSLKQLADEANLYTKRGDDCIKLGLTFYFEAGRRLNEAKKRVGHGNWQNWLAQNFSASDDTANNYMKLARRFGEQKSETFRNLNPATAIKLLALPEGTEEEFIQMQAAAGKPVENQSARDVQKNVKAFKEARAMPKENAEEPTPDLSNVGEKFSVFGRETDEVTHDSEFVSEPVSQDSAKQEETAADDTAPTTKTVDEPVTNEFKLAAIKTFETWLNYIEVIGSTISETQLNSLLKLCGEYWRELEKQFTYEKKLARIAEHILKSVKEICAQNSELAVKIKLSCAELEQAQENQKK